MSKLKAPVSPQRAVWMPTSSTRPPAGWQGLVKITYPTWAPDCWPAEYDGERYWRLNDHAPLQPSYWLRDNANLDGKKTT